MFLLKYNEENDTLIITFDSEVSLDKFKLTDKVILGLNKENFVRHMTINRFKADVDNNPDKSYNSDSEDARSKRWRKLSLWRSILKNS